MAEEERTQVRGHNIGFVFQSFHLVKTLSLVENVAIPLMILGEERIKALEHAYALLAQVGLEKRSDASPALCSGGECQRAAICRAIIHHPSLIVCDEPTSALDHVTGGHVMRLLKERAINGQRSLIVVTHDARIFSYADRIAMMEDGKILNIHDVKNGDLPEVSH
jgi:putative ABC transport system ATP-binding protein